MEAQLTELTARHAVAAFGRRECPANALAADADRIALACHAMAARFVAGARLVVFGDGGAGCDAAHVVVEFVHPVIVGKPALPAFALPGPNLRGQLELLAAPGDIALGLSAGPPVGEVADALRLARQIGLLSVGLFGGAAAATAPGHTAAAGGPPPGGPGPEVAEYLFVVPSEDPRVVKEVQVTNYHVLWELVHVFADSGL